MGEVCFEPRGGSLFEFVNLGKAGALVATTTEEIHNETTRELIHTI